MGDDLDKIKEDQEKVAIFKNRKRQIHFEKNFIKPLLDKEGNPVLDENGIPKPEFDLTKETSQEDFDEYMDVLRQRHLDFLKERKKYFLEKQSSYKYRLANIAGKLERLDKKIAEREPDNG